jgi:glycosyltransferase involved in cell wall biosynthesis
MKVGVLSYQMLFQSIGGLQNQIVETLSALKEAGCDARLMDARRERLTEYDLIHVFAAINGNFRVVQAAKRDGVPVVLSPLLQPSWTSSLGKRAKLASSVFGRITRWEARTEYDEIRHALEQADRLIALGIAEKRCIEEAFGIPADRTQVIPNGIGDRFFSASAQCFTETYRIEPGFVLAAGTISPYKNQLGVVKALAGTGTRIVLIGPCDKATRPYLESIVSFPEVTYLGAMDYQSPMLASAYAAAGVLCLASHSEVMPLVVLEALAAGTPAVLTQHHSMDTASMLDCIIEVSPNSLSDIASAVTRLLATPPSALKCRTCVEKLTWRAVGDSLLTTYRSLLGGKDLSR